MEAFAWALAGSFLSTLPIGPINLVLIMLALQRRWKGWVAACLGVTVADVGVSLAGLLLSETISHWVHQKWGHLALALVLIGFGIMLLKQGAAQIQAKERHGLGLFALGFFSTLLEPALPIFWAGWWMEAGDFGPEHGLQVAAGVLAGDFAVFGAYAGMVRFIPKFASIQTYNRAIGSLFLAGGMVYLAWWTYAHYLEGFL